MKTMRKGFTLIELMVVLAILAILVTITSYAVIYALDEANFSASGVLITNVTAGCTNYFTDRNNRYPANGADMNDHNNLVLGLAGKIYATDPSLYKDPYMDLKLENLIGSAAGADFQIVDAWDQPIYYANLLNTTGGSDVSPTGYSTANWKNRRGVDVWSAGKDGTDDASGMVVTDDFSTVDDGRINNWGRQE